MKLLLLCAGIMTSLLLSGGVDVFAQIPGGGDPSPSNNLDNPLANGGIHSISDLLQKIIQYLTTVAGPILVIMIIIGAFKILTAGDNETKYQSGKKTITYAVVGFAIILIGWGFVFVIEEFLGVSNP
jgi:hypothetical protein